jgi:hypothetical protein
LDDANTIYRFEPHPPFGGFFDAQGSPRMTDMHCVAEKELVAAVAGLRVEVKNLKEEVERLHMSVDILTRQAARWKGGLGLLLILGGLAAGVLSAFGWLVGKP